MSISFVIKFTNILYSMDQLKNKEFRECDSSIYTSPEVNMYKINVERGFASSRHSGNSDGLGDPLNGSW